MTEVLFYHLQDRPLDGVLPQLLEKTLERGWCAAVQSPSEERLDALDALLWTYRSESFLPHATWRDTNAPGQPVLLSMDAENVNGAQVRFLLDLAPLPPDMETYARIVLIFDGEDDAALAFARAAWAAVKAQGLEATYWQCDEAGRWQRKA